MRASYGLFGSQLGTGTVQSFSAASQARADLLGDRSQRQQRRRSRTSSRRCRISPASIPPIPAPGVNFNRIDPDLKAPKTHEFVVGVDRELMPQFGVSASLSWRRFTDVIWSGQDLAQQITVYPLVGVTARGLQLEGVVEGNVAGHRRLPPASTSRRANRACRPATAASSATVPTTTSSISASRCRRPSGCRTGGWRASASRPTVTPSTSAATRRMQDPGPSTTWPNIDGGAFVTGTSGSGKSEIYLILPRYQLTASGLYQLPWGINVAGNLVAREGYGMPFFEPVESADPVLPEKRVLLVDPRESRLPGVDVARSARREVVHVRRPRAGAVAGPVQRVQLVDGAGPPVRRDRHGQHRLQPAAGDHESAAAALRRAVPVLDVTARAATRRSCRTLVVRCVGVAFHGSSGHGCRG